MGFLFKRRKPEDLAPKVEEPEFLKEVEDTIIPKGAIREEVEPELALWLSNGSTVRNLKELAAALKKISAKDYREHVTEERNEVAEWVQEILNDEELARHLRKARTKLKSTACIEKRIKQLKSAKKAKPAKKAEDKLPKLLRIISGKSKTDALAGMLEIPPITELPLQVEPKKSSLWPFRKRKAETKAEEAIEEKNEVLPELPVEEPEMEEEFAGLPQLPDIELPAPENKAAKKGKKFVQWPAKHDALEQEPEEILPLPQPPENIPEPDMDFTIASEPEPKKQRGFFLFRKRQKAEPEAVPLQAGPIEPAPLQFPEPHREAWEEPSKAEEMPEEKAEETKPLPEPVAEKQYKARRETRSYEEAALEKREQEINDQEKELGKEEEYLNRKRLDVTQKRYELIKQRGQVEREKFEMFMEKQKLSREKEEALLDRQGWGTGEGSQMKGMPDFRLSGAYGKERLEALLEEAKQHIRQNNVDEARKALQEVQSVFSTTFMTSNEKKQLEYDMLEIEADIKLASLS